MRNCCGFIYLLLHWLFCSHWDTIDLGKCIKWETLALFCYENIRTIITVFRVLSTSTVLSLKMRNTRCLWQWYLENSNKIKRSSLLTQKLSSLTLLSCMPGSFIHVSASISFLICLCMCTIYYEYMYWKQFILHNL